MCVDSGDLPNAHCPHTVETWYIPGKSPIRVSQLHRAVAIDGSTGRPGVSAISGGHPVRGLRVLVVGHAEAVPPGGHAAPRPAAFADLRNARSAEAARIASPLRGVSYALRRSAPQEVIALDASTAADVQSVFWFDGSALIGGTPVAEGALAWRPTTSGVHLIRVVDDHGRSAEREVEVQLGQ